MSARDQLFHVVYVSRQKAGLSRDEIVDRIVLPAMLKNHRLNISGCIWFDNTNFFQVLEGVKSEVLNLYRLIEKDRRHHTPRVLAAQPIDRRDFERYSMRLISEGTPAGVHQIISQFGSVQPDLTSPKHGPAVFVRRIISEISAQFV